VKNYRLSGLLIVGLLMIPGVVRAGEADPAAYLEMSIHYEAIRLALLGDSMEGMAEHARAIHQQASSLLEGLSAESAGVSADQVADYEAALREMESAASNLSAASGLASAREDFFTLTKPMARYRKITGDQDTVVAYCPWRRRPGSSQKERSETRISGRKCPSAEKWSGSRCGVMNQNHKEILQ